MPWRIWLHLPKTHVIQTLEQAMVVGDSACESGKDALQN